METLDLSVTAPPSPEVWQIPADSGRSTDGASIFLKTINLLASLNLLETSHLQPGCVNPLEFL